MTTDAGIAALAEHFRTQMSGYDYSAQRPEPIRVPVPGSPVSVPSWPGAPDSDTAEPGAAAAGWQAQIVAQIGALAGDMRALTARRDADHISWQDVHPFDLPFSGASQSIAAGQTLTSETWGPRAGFVWDVRRVTVQGLNGPGSSSSSTATGTITAGAGAANLAAGVSVTGFTLSFSAAPSTTGTATLTGVAGGPITYDIPAGQTSPYTVQFPAAIAAAGTPTLTIAGLGTGAGAIVLYGLGAGAAGDGVTVFKAPIAAAAGAVPLAAIDNITGSGAGSDLLITQKGAFLMSPGDALLVAGAYSATNIAVSGSGTEIALHRLPWYLK